MKIRTVAAFVGLVMTTVALAQTSNLNPGESNETSFIARKGKKGYFSKFSGTSRKHRNWNCRADFPDARLRHKYRPAVWAMLRNNLFCREFSFRR